MTCIAMLYRCVIYYYVPGPKQGSNLMDSGVSGVMN